jgi:hypothetical protein
LQELNLQSEKSKLDQLARSNHREMKQENPRMYEAKTNDLGVDQNEPGSRAALGEKRGLALGGEVRWQN